MDFDGKVRAKQFALHALDAVFRSWGSDQKDIHLQDILRAEFDADAAAFALCRENKLPIVIFDLIENGNIGRAVRGEVIGTLVA